MEKAIWVNIFKVIKNQRLLIKSTFIAGLFNVVFHIFFTIPSAGQDLRDTSVIIEWPYYAGDAGGSKFSPATHVHTGNVKNLKVAWIYRTGDYGLGKQQMRFESTPIYVDGILYATTPFSRVIALNPETGEELWNFDPMIDFSGRYGNLANRGVSTWLDPESKAGDFCNRRIFLASIDARLIALDAKIGKPCTDFGSEGTVDLNEGLENGPAFIGEYKVTSPPAIINNLVITGSSITDNHRAEAPSGIVRAFHARTGKLIWSWDPILRSHDLLVSANGNPDKFIRTGAANVWSIISVDNERNLVFVPVGSASPDFYGGNRPGHNLYANSVVALNALTGEVVWHFQTVHHDLWDYDVAAQPVLTEITRDGQKIPVVIQATKMGFLYVLHRETGEPVFPVEERPVPQSDVPGELTSPTQPFPVTDTHRLTKTSLTKKDVWGPTLAARNDCRKQLKGLRNEGIFTPPSLQGSIVFPGNIGGSNWGGIAVDPQRGIILAPTNRLFSTIQLVKRDQVNPENYKSADEFAHQLETPYAVVRHHPRTWQRFPCSRPPFGTLQAIGLHDAHKFWEVSMGNMPFTEKIPGKRDLGSVFLGGGMITGGGLYFMAATYDRNFRAHDVNTGKVLWKYKLPAAGNAAPMTYQTANGRQYVVIAAGGHDMLRTKSGDYLIAFALNDNQNLEGSLQNRQALTGRYTGQLILPGERLLFSITVDEKSKGRISGSLHTSGNSIQGFIAGKRKGQRVKMRIEYINPDNNCSSVISGKLDLANRNLTMIGKVTVGDTCREDSRIKTVLTLRKLISNQE